MYQIYARTRQYLFHKAFLLMRDPRPTLLKGQNSIQKIPSILKREGIHRVEIITTSGTIKRGLLQPLLDQLDAKQIHSIIDTEVCPDPTIECIEHAVDLYQRGSCEAIVAIGGGSVLDCAKITGACIACPDRSILQMTGALKIRKKLPPILAVPTTAGTGSEVTAGAVITDAQTHYKHTIVDLCLIPKYAILDPTLTRTLPADLTASTGMDALTHAIEAYINCFTPLRIKKYAKNAVKRIFRSLPIAFENGNDLTAREDLLLGSCQAGIAITNAYVGYVHAIAHGIGGLYGIPHGYANAVILPKVLKAYGPAVYPGLAELADAVGIPGDTTQQKAKAFIQAIDLQNRKYGFPQTLSCIQEKDIPKLSKRACKEANPFYPVPVIWNRRQLEKVIRRL